MIIILYALNSVNPTKILPLLRHTQMESKEKLDSHG